MTQKPDNPQDTAPMILKDLRIRLEPYGENKGKYEGKAEFESKYGTVSVRIGAAESRRILEICADAIIRESEKVADAMIAPLIEQQKEPLYRSN